MVLVVILSCVVLSLDSPGLEGQGPGHKSRVVVSISEAITIAILTFEQVHTHISYVCIYSLSNFALETLSPSSSPTQTRQIKLASPNLFFPPLA